MPNRGIQIVLLLVLLTGVVLPLAAAERQSLASISLQAEAFLAGFDWASPYPPEFEIQTLDSRLNLHPCANGLGIDFRQREKTRGQTSLEIRCPGPVSWRIYLPVRVELFDNVLVTRKPILRGQQVSAGDVKLRKARINDLHHGYFTDVGQLHRMQASRNLKTGTVLSPTLLSAQNIIESGQSITIVLDIRGLTVKSVGKALQSATVGELIKVRNLRSNRVVEGRVSATGEVRVGL